MTNPLSPGTSAISRRPSRFAAATLALGATFLFLPGCSATANQVGPTRATSDAAVSTTSPGTPKGCSTPVVKWSVRQLAEQIIVVSVEEDNVSLVAPEVAGGAGGVILFGATAPSNLAASLRSLVASTPGGVARFIMTDEEGGVAQRMANLVGSIPSARQMGATMTPGQIRRLAKQLAKRMLGVGVTMDLAPSSTWTEGRGLMTGTPTARGRSVLTRRSPPRMASHSRLAYAKAG